MRYKSIDILRGAAIVEMVVVHFVDYLTTPPIYYYFMPFRGWFGAPTFLMLSGMSYHIGVESQKNKIIAAATKKYQEDAAAILSYCKHQSKILRNKLMQRGVALFLLAVPLMAITQYGAVALECDSVVSSALSQIVVAYFLWEKSSSVLLVVYLLIIFVAPLLRIWANTFHYWYWDRDWKSGLLRDDYPYYTPMDIIKLHLVVGYFPLFPYACFYILGVLVGRVLVPRAHFSNFIDNQVIQSKQVEVGQQKKQVRNLAILGIILFFVGKKWLAKIPSDHPYLGGWSTFQLTFPSSIGKTGRSLMGFGVASYLFDFQGIRCERDNNGVFDKKFSTRKSYQMIQFLEKIATLFSHHSLTMYFLHSAVIFWPMHVLGWWNQVDWWDEYGEKSIVEPWKAVALGYVFLIVTYYSLVWMDHNQIPRLEHVLQSLCHKLWQ